MSTEASAATSVYGFSADSIDGDPVRLDQFRGQVLLIVNVASRCGYTPQYAGLEALFRRHRDRGFTVLGFPCNQFGHQEPGTDRDIRHFCESTYGITFPMFSRIAVKGPEAHPLFTFLTDRRRGLLGSRSIKWNFTKFLVDRRGMPVARFGSRVAPAAIERPLGRLLDE